MRALCYLRKCEVIDKKKLTKVGSVKGGTTILDDTFTVCTHLEKVILTKERHLSVIGA